MAHLDGPDFHYVNDGNAMDIRNFTDKDLFTFVGLEVQQQRQAGQVPAKRDKVNFFFALYGRV